MSKYTKSIQVLCNGLICACVYRDGEEIGRKFFSPIIHTVRGMERSGDRAMNWANQYISMADWVEVP